MSDRHPPGPKGVPVLGNLPGLGRGMVEFMMEAATHGDIASFTIGPTRNYLISHPDHIHDVLVARRDRFTKDPHDLRTLGRWMGRGLLTSDGEHHRRQRRLVQPAFRHRRMTGYGEIAVDSTLRQIEGWRSGEVHDMHHEMMKLTLNVVSRSMFGSGVSDEEAYKVQRAVAGLQDIAINISKFGMLVSPWLLLPLHQLLKRGTRVLDEAVMRIIAERRASGEDRGDLLSMFLMAQDEVDGGGMTDQQVRDEAVTIFVAGQETTANGLTWAWYLLSQHPEVAEKLGAELDEVLGDRPPTAEDLPRLRYTGMVFKEALRFCPPAWTLNKRTPVEDVELGGYRIRRGAGIFIMPYVMHHLERYFPEPFRFDPERFAPDREATIPRYAFMPFGGGERICVGAGFAEMEAKLILATLAQRFRFTLEPDQKVALKPLVTLAPKYGLRMRVSERG
ncbi:cytochrome P450 [Micromonospora sagamiensis]|uniref:Cytochrome P450 n=1 Tax=Micromonospora sagamiensis TaxID=47875 RepID=A0A562WFV7_9ACTN|nr:cytochrome P450 [Micromonospora sagamiensis]TWJ29025.1 cytochrome P450 [Micromonospora sagamiensis]BCL17950.1 cytochrome P450 [Micromonospora sagamiensis]